MGLSELLDRIKEALGVGGSRGQSERRPPQSGDETATEPTSEETTVTVEREPSTESEDAVKGTDTAAEAASTPSTEAEDAEDEATSASDVELETDEEPTEAETDEESTETETDEEPTEAETDEEPSEAGADEEAVESTEDEAPSETGADEDLGTDEPTDVIKGIGSAYADRLADAGVETVADLAARDAETLSEETDISEKRLQTWIERAKHR